MKNQLDIIFSDIDNGESIKRAIKNSPEEIIDLLKKSGLKGRGGAGFPTGKKWEMVFNEVNEDKYIVCNADEGEPGTFKDRQIIEKQSKKIIESMIIAAYVISAQKGFIYLRGEYTYLKKKIQETLKKYHHEKLLGEDILGLEGFNFDIEIRMGAGAYICGEETALLESLEGRRGESRFKPPFPVSNGFKKKPTIINNVETLCYIPHIILNGADWFKCIGTQESTGYKLFSVSGDCNKPGIYEFEFGISINKLLKVVDAHDDIKAVQIGGAGGFCASSDEFDKHLCFEGIPTGGSIIILNKSRNMLNVLLNFADFFKSESCGQCTPCREGSYRIYQGLLKFKEKKGSSKLLNELLKLSETMKITSKCGLGQSIPNSFQTIVSKFKDEILVGFDLI